MGLLSIVPSVQCVGSLIGYTEGNIHELLVNQTFFYIALGGLTCRTNTKPRFYLWKYFFYSEGKTEIGGCLREVLRGVLEFKRAVTADWVVIVYNTEIRNV